MSKHTAGPWEYQKGACDIITKDKWIADIKWLSSEDDANGFLIAAAPELLEALKRALEWGESEIHNEYDGASMLKERLAELDFLRAAISKAEGVA